MFSFFNKIMKKKQEEKIQEEKIRDYEAIKRSIIENLSIDSGGNELFDAKIYNEMCKLKISKSGKIQDLIVEMKKEISGKIITESVLMSEVQDNPELPRMLAESARLRKKEAITSNMSEAQKSEDEVYGKECRDFNKDSQSVICDEVR